MRINGPYKHGKRWRVVVVGEGGKQDPQSYETREQALEVIASLRRQLAAAGDEPIDRALDRYRTSLRARDLAASTVTTEIERLEMMLAGVVTVGELTPGRAAKLYAARTEAVAAGTHRGELGAAKRFGRWLVAAGLSKRPAFDAVKAIGRKRRGKKQPTIDEARTFSELAIARAWAGDVGALGSMTLLELGIRPGELLGLDARDVDDRGRIVWIRRDHTKTDAGERRVEVPAALQPLLVRHAKSAKTGRLFAFKKGWPRHQVRRLCDLAGIEKVCAQALRGLHATLATEAGATSHAVAKQLGHTSTVVTEAHYTDEVALARAKRRRTQAVIGDVG